MDLVILAVAAILILSLATLMVFCAVEDVKNMQQYEQQLHVPKHDPKQIERALQATNKIRAIQNQNLSPEETNKQILGVLNEYEANETNHS